MAEVEYSTAAKLPIDVIWNFVQDMDNWAPFVSGYQRHERKSDTESVWTLKGDVGVLSRVLVFQVRVTQWDEPERVRFELEGVNEPMQGSGSFEALAYQDESRLAQAPRKRLLRRLLEQLARWLFRLRHGRAPRASSADVEPGEGMAKLTFKLRIEPGGPMAPMIDAMIAPLMLPAAESLANRIMAQLEAAESERR